MKLGFYKDRIFPVVFMFLLCFVFISILSLVYLFTRDKIKSSEQLHFKKNVLAAASLILPGNDKDLENLYAQSAEEIRENGTLSYIRIKGQGNEILNYIYIIDGPGLWGAITAIIGMDEEKQNITGFEILSQNETPGLGARIEELWFKKQFRGKGPFPGNEFQAITGATITTTAVLKMVNKFMETKNGKI